MNKSTHKKLFKEANLLIAKKKNEGFIEVEYSGSIITLGDIISNILYSLSTKSNIHEEVIIAVAKEYLMTKLEERGEL